MSGGAFLDVADQMRQLGRDLKTAGDKDLKKELMAAGRATGKTAQGEVRKHALTDLPHQKGLNVWVASRAKVTASTRLTGKNCGLRLKIRHKGVNGITDLPAINAGRLRHPTFADTPWVLQPIAPGFASRAIDEVGDTLVENFRGAVDEVARKLAAGG